MKFLVRMSYEKEDYDAFARLSGKALDRGRTLGVRLGMLVAAAFFVFVAAYMTIEGDKSVRTWSWLMFVVALLFVCVSIFYYPYQSWMLRKRQTNEAEETTYNFKDDHFDMTSAAGTTSHKYVDLKKVYETEDHFFLMLSAKSALVLPKRSFVVGKAKGFRAFLEERMGSRVVDLSL